MVLNEHYGYSRIISNRTPHRKAKIPRIAVVIIACGMKINQLANAEILLGARVALTLLRKPSNRIGQCRASLFRFCWNLLSKGISLWNPIGCCGFRATISTTQNMYGESTRFELYRKTNWHQSVVVRQISVLTFIQFAQDFHHKKERGFSGSDGFARIYRTPATHSPCARSISITLKRWSK